MTRDDLLASYDILGLKPGASFREVRAAYRQLVREWHPDQFMHDESLRRTAERQMKLINLAYENLKRFLSFDTVQYHWPNQPPYSWARRRNAVSRFRQRTHRWWRKLWFCFEDPDFFGPSLWDRLKTMWIGAAAIVVLFAVGGIVDALPAETKETLETLYLYAILATPLTTLASVFIHRQS